MKTNGYSKLLRDPRWQKARLEILERDDWRCNMCGDDTQTLHIHHCNGYVKGRAPWDYPAEDLQTLCEPCHKLAHQLANLVPGVVVLDEMGFFSYQTGRCPHCGSAKLKDKGTYDKCIDCPTVFGYWGIDRLGADSIVSPACR